MTQDDSLRAQIIKAVSQGLNQVPQVLAGWEGGSASWDALDAFSDIDLNFLVEDDASLDLLYAGAEKALAAVSPITGSHVAPPGRYYKLRDGGEFLLVDLCFFRVGAPDHSLDVERHGQAVPLFDKGNWLTTSTLDAPALAAKRDKRYQELRNWFPLSQGFVRKAILRDQQTEALSAYWGYTIKPLTELLRIRHCPVRWDFGLRYLERDLPSAAGEQLRDLVFVRDLDDLQVKLRKAEAWGLALLQDLHEHDQRPSVPPGAAVAE